MEKLCVLVSTDIDLNCGLEAAWIVVFSSFYRPDRPPTRLVEAAADSQQPLKKPGLTKALGGK